MLNVSPTQREFETLPGLNDPTIPALAPLPVSLDGSDMPLENSESEESTEEQASDNHFRKCYSR